MNYPDIQLNIGDEIGFVYLASDADSNDKVLFFPVVEITVRDGERAYRYQYPDGDVSRSAIRQSQLSSHVIRLNRRVEIKPEKSEMICLSDRKNEFVEALNRAKDADLEVFADWELDSFHVKNHDNGKEYDVNLDSSGGRVFAECDCPDFVFRKRVCKHIGAVLTDTVFGMLARR